MSRNSFSNRWGNPILTANKLEEGGFGYRAKGMTRFGTFMKLVLFLAVLVVAGGYNWSKAFEAFGDFDFSTVQTETIEVNGKQQTERYVLSIDPETGQEEKAPLPKFDLSEVTRLMWIGIIGGLIFGLITIFVPKAAMVTGFIYAAMEGLALGGISAYYEAQFPGIAMTAALSSLATMLAMSMVYATGLIRLGRKGTAFVAALTLGVLLFYVSDMLLGVFFGSRIEVIHSNSTTSIVISGVICAIAAFNFLVDFETIEDGVEMGAPKYMEWYCAFGVMVTLVWLYIEVLRFLAKAKSRR